MSRLSSRVINNHEESPSSTGQGCQVTPGGGDSKDSATEIYRLLMQVRVERWGKSPPAAR